MHIATIINLFLLPCLVTILLTGAILNIKYTKYNIYRQYLIYSLLFWAMVMCLIYIKFFVEGSTTISYSQELFSVPVLLLGILQLQSDDWRCEKRYSNPKVYGF